jgi:hypothetical protein
MPSVQPSALAHAIREVLRHRCPKDAAEVILEATPDELFIERMGARLPVAWEGACAPALARVPAAQLRRLARALSGRAPISVHLTPDALRVGTLTLRCRPAARLPAEPTLAMGATPPQILHVALSHGAADLEAAGLGGLVAVVEADRDRRIARALAALGPLGVDAAGLRALVDGAVRGVRV